MSHGSQLQLDDVVRVYRGFSLGPVSTTFPRGVTALLGANGAGKSTLMRLLARTERPDSGRITLAGVAGDGRIGYLPQDFAGPKNVTAEDFLRYAAWCRTTREHRLGDHDVARALDLVGLSSRAGSRIGRLSGGMVRRLGVAQAVLGGADLLVLDEPTVGLDPVQRHELRALVRALADRTIVLVSTHLAEDVAALAERVLVLDDGRTLLDGPAADLAALSETGADVSAESVELGFLRLLRTPGVADVA